MGNFSKLNPCYLRQKTIESIFEDKVNPSLKNSLKLFGYGLLETACTLSVVPGIYYAIERAKPGTAERIKRDASYYLWRKGHPLVKISEFMNDFKV